MNARLPAFARTTTFRLALLYVVLIAIYSAALLGYLYVATVGYMRTDTDARIASEVDSIMRAYQGGGLARVSQSLMERAATPDGYFLYQLETPSGIKIVGDLSEMPADGTGKVQFELAVFHNDGSTRMLNAEGQILSLGEEARLLVAFDAGERSVITRRITYAVYTAAGVGLALSLIGGIMISRSVARRAEELAATAEAVMGGDLTRRAPQSTNKDEFDRLAERMNAMLDRLEHLVKASRHTGDAIAHDLRSPLSRMRNRLEAALATPNPSGDSREALAETLEEVDRVLTTFNAILRLSRLDARTDSRLVRLDIRDIVTEMAELFEPAAEAAGLAFKAERGRPTEVLGDPDLIAQALSNLIDNAIKYTPEGGAIRVYTRRAEGDRIDLVVQDTGPGIPEHERARVIERFERLEPARTLPGSGLGLSLVAAVAEVLQGEFLMLDGDGPPQRPGLRAILRLPRA